METVGEFISELDYFILEKQEFDMDNISLMGGVTGVIYYCFQSSNTKLHDKGYHLLDKLIEEITNREVLRFTYADGMCGVLYLLNNLKQNGWIEDKLDDFLYPYEQFIISNIIPRDLSIDNKDFLYGILGYLHYFVSKDVSLYNEEIIKNLIHCLIETAVDREDFLFLTNKYYNDKKVVFNGKVGEKDSMGDVINFGIAHGNLAFGIILLDTIEKYPHLEEINHFVVKLAKLYIDNVYYENLAKRLTLFPNLKLADQVLFNAIPMSWCYGDLSIAIFFIRLFKLTRNDTYEKIALKIVEGYRNFEGEIDSRINPYYCHGYIGFIAQFETISEITENEFDAFEVQSVKIMKIISRQIENEKSLSSYFEKNLDMLNGVLAIPLIFNSSVKNWKKIFLN